MRRKPAQLGLPLRTLPSSHNNANDKAWLGQLCEVPFGSCFFLGNSITIDRSACFSNKTNGYRGGAAVAVSQTSDDGPTLADEAGK